LNPARVCPWIIPSVDLLGIHLIEDSPPVGCGSFIPQPFDKPGGAAQARPILKIVVIMLPGASPSGPAPYVGVDREAVAIVWKPGPRHEIVTAYHHDPLFHTITLQELSAEAKEAVDWKTIIL
jgi:hypothetical protein